MCARMAYSARRARSRGSSVPSGSTARSYRCIAARRAGAVRAERSTVRAHDALTAMRARSTRSDFVRRSAALEDSSVGTPQ
jgi:hypothetical protein